MASYKLETTFFSISPILFSRSFDWNFSDVSISSFHFIGSIRFEGIMFKDYFSLRDANLISSKHLRGCRKAKNNFSSKMFDISFI